MLRLSISGTGSQEAGNSRRFLPQITLSEELKILIRSTPRPSGCDKVVLVMVLKKNTGADLAGALNAKVATSVQYTLNNSDYIFEIIWCNKHFKKSIRTHTHTGGGGTNRKNTDVGRGKAMIGKEKWLCVSRNIFTEFATVDEANIALQIVRGFHLNK